MWASAALGVATAPSSGTAVSCPTPPANSNPVMGTHTGTGRRMGERHTKAWRDCHQGRRKTFTLTSCSNNHCYREGNTDGSDICGNEFQECWWIRKKCVSVGWIDVCRYNYQGCGFSVLASASEISIECLNYWALMLWSPRATTGACAPHGKIWHDATKTWCSQNQLINQS